MAPDSTGQTDPRVPWFSWISLAIVGTLMALAALWVALTPVADQTELAERTWQTFAQEEPEVASLYAMDLVVLGLFGAGLGLLAAAVALIPYRHGDRWAWFALWLVPITIGAVAVRMLADQYSAGYVYAVLAAVALIALLPPIREFLGRRT